MNPGLTENTFWARTSSDRQIWQCKDVGRPLDEYKNLQLEPCLIVCSAYFANTRSSTDATSEALELAYKLLQRSSDEEKQCNGWEFIAQGAKFVKVFSTRCPFVNDTVGLMMDKRDLRQTGWALDHLDERTFSRAIRWSKYRSRFWIEDQEHEAKVSWNFFQHRTKLNILAFPHTHTRVLQGHGWVSQGPSTLSNCQRQLHADHATDGGHSCVSTEGEELAQRKKTSQNT